MKIQYILIFSAILSLSACDSSHSSSTPQPQPQSTPVPPSGTPTNNGSDAGTGNGGADGTSPSTDPTSTGAIAGVLGLRSGLTITQADFLRNLGSSVAKRTEEFHAASDALNQSAQAYCASYDPAQLETLKLHFRDAMMVWQQIELLQMGPLTENSGSLKVKIYGWPQLSNYCKIDEESLAAASDGEYLLPTNTNRKGLQALEYLIYDSTLTSICPASNPTKAEWEALSGQKKWEARCAYMKPVASELLANAIDLQTRWGTASDNYVSRGIGSPDSEHGILQEIFNGIFYVDIEMKNQKIAAVAGQDVLYCNKTPSPCPDKDELHYSHLSKEALTANFRALADLIFGFGDLRTGGLTALLRNDNGSDTADRSEKNVVKLVTLSEDQTDSLDALIAAKQNENCELTQNSWFCKVRQSIKDVVADFKGEYASVLKVQVPAAPQGDND